MNFPNKKSELRYEAWQRIKSWLISIILIIIVIIAILVFVSFGRNLAEIVSFSHTPDEILSLEDTKLYGELDLSSANLASWKKIFTDLNSDQLTSIERFINDNIKTNKNGWIDKKISIALLNHPEPVFFLRTLDRSSAVNNIETLFGSSELLYPRDLIRIYQLKNHGLYYTFWQNYLLLSRNSQNLKTALNLDKKDTLITDVYYKKQKTNNDQNLIFLYFDWSKYTNQTGVIGELSDSLSQSVIQGQLQDQGISWQWQEKNRLTLFSQNRKIQGNPARKFPANTRAFITGSDLIRELDSPILAQTQTSSAWTSYTGYIKNKYGLSLSEDIAPLFAQNYAIGQTASGWLVTINGDIKKISDSIDLLIDKIQENYALLNPVVIDTVYSNGRPIQVLSENPDPIRITTEEVSGISIHSFPLSSLPILAYSQLDDSSYLLSNSTGAIALGIQAFRGQIDSLSSDPNFENTQNNLIDQNSLIYLEDFDWIVSFLGLEKYQDFFDRFQSISIGTSDQSTNLYLQAK